MADGGKGDAPGGDASRDDEDFQIVRRGDTVQRRRRRINGWTTKKKAAFLTVLGDTCNIREAARSVGMSKSAVYYLRARDPRFRQQWDEMVERGYAELELALLQQALEGTVRTEMVHDGAEADGVVKQVRTVHSFPLPTMVRLWIAHRSEARRERNREGAPLTNGEAARSGVLAKIMQIRAQWGDARALALPAPVVEASWEEAE